MVSVRRSLLGRATPQTFSLPPLLTVKIFSVNCKTSQLGAQLGGQAKPISQHQQHPPQHQARCQDDSQPAEKNWDFKKRPNLLKRTALGTKLSNFENINIAGKILRKIWNQTRFVKCCGMNWNGFKHGTSPAAPLRKQIQMRQKKRIVVSDPNILLHTFLHWITSRNDITRYEIWAWDTETL